MNDDYDLDLLDTDYWDGDKEQFVLYERSPNLQLNARIKDFDGVIGQEQDERDDTDQMADIMQLIHIPGHND